MLCYDPNLSTARAWALAASMSRFLDGELVTSELRSFEEAIATSATARLKASSFTMEGLANPLIFLTNCRAAAWISSSVAGGLKLYSTLMFLHTLFTSAIAYRRTGSASRDRRVTNTDRSRVRESRPNVPLHPPRAESGPKTRSLVCHVGSARPPIASGATRPMCKRSLGAKSPRCARNQYLRSSPSHN